MGETKYRDDDGSNSGCGRMRDDTNRAPRIFSYFRMGMQALSERERGNQQYSRKRNRLAQARTVELSEGLHGG